MRILICEPGKHPRVADIPHTLHEMQKIVGGLIEVVHPWPDPVVLVCDDEYLFKGYPFNRMVDGKLPVYGTFFLCGDADEDFSDLSDELAEKYLRKLYLPQVMIETPVGMIILPMDAEEE